MSDQACNVLFLCTGNSARSILGEAILNQIGNGRFRAFSAGSHPKGAVHPMALELLNSLGHPTGTLRSKSWNEFAQPDAPKFDVIFTVCDDAAAETCPVWPGHPMTVHWGIPDPAAVEGPEADRRAAFAAAYDTLSERLAAFAALPVSSMDARSLKNRLVAIGQN